MGIAQMISNAKERFRKTPYQQEQEIKHNIKQAKYGAEHFKHKKELLQTQRNYETQIKEQRNELKNLQRQPMREKLQGVQQFFQGVGNTLKDKKLQRNIKQKRLQRLGRGVTSEPNPAFQNESRNVFNEVGNAKPNPAFYLGMKNHNLERPSLLGMKQKKRVNFNVFK